jgi:hypothetical protein
MCTNPPFKQDIGVGNVTLPRLCGSIRKRFLSQMTDHVNNILFMNNM